MFLRLNVVSAFRRIKDRSINCHRATTSHVSRGTMCREKNSRVLSLNRSFKSWQRLARLNFVPWRRRRKRLGERARAFASTTIRETTRGATSVSDDFRLQPERRTREKGVSRTRCRMPGLFLSSSLYFRYVRHVCLRNIFFAKYPLRAIILPPFLLFHFPVPGSASPPQS